MCSASARFQASHDGKRKKKMTPKLQPGDYYIESGKWIFTEQYHLRRGWCCNNECRHCPFNGEIGILDNKKEDNDGTKCPLCGRIKAVVKQEDIYFCTHCDMLFDPRED